MSTAITTNVDNIVNRVTDGFYQTSTATKAEGWPIDTNNWCHLISQTHTNGDNYFAMQIAGGFFDTDLFYIRKTNGNGNEAWHDIVHSRYVPVNVRSFGGKVDGVTDDGPAFTAARDAAVGYGIIDVPPGPYHVAGGIGVSDPEPKLWRLAGNSYDGGGAPVVNVVSGDVVETFFEGMKYFGRQGGNAKRPNQTVMRVDGVFDQAGSGGNPNTVRFNTDLRPVTIKDNVWGVSAVMTSRATSVPQQVGDVVGQHVSLNGSVFRPAYEPGETVQPRSQVWAGYLENNDQTNLDAHQAGSQVGLENDIYCNGDDPYGYRIINQMVGGRSIAAKDGGRPAQVGYAMNVSTTDDDCSFGTILFYRGKHYKAAIDMSQAVALNNQPTLLLPNHGTIAWESSNAVTTRYIDGVIQHRLYGNEFYNIDQDGNSTQPGYVKAPYLRLDDRDAPTSTSDPRGVYGDTLFSGNYLYRKTSSGWYRTEIHSF
ncbi:hypothetical protein [Methylobacterium indicum]|uniref:Pectate lyase superfamily protein domain-containing protein n=1 Tax=Methylobacterium indicum TaxID=1775910 RepID=A0A8H9C9Y6_9HYPH|nr:hypothetical protein [Methylobacterium indicum]BCM87738.1 hypothetical protein mvi_61990 [Methylobacterium indicum]